MVKPIDENALTIYTDGSSYSGPRRGGVGILFVAVDDDGHEFTVDYPLPGYAGANNNQAELQACIDALSAVATGRAPLDASAYKRIEVRTDSMYVVENIYNARYVWPVMNWTTRDGNPVLNAPLWKELVRVAHRAHRRVDFEWVKGHKKDLHNRAADKLAKRSAAVRTDRQLSVVKVRRKKSQRPLDPGSVHMLGQRITIRIITDEYLPVQDCNRYKYEVLSRASPFFGCVDVIYSSAQIHLSAGHTYHVRLNTETSAPRVIKCFREMSSP